MYDIKRHIEENINTHSLFSRACSVFNQWGDIHPSIPVKSTPQSFLNGYA